MGVSEAKCPFLGPFPTTEYCVGTDGKTVDLNSWMMISENWDFLMEGPTETFPNHGPAAAIPFGFCFRVLRPSDFD
jgi:hypothetical protein